MRLAGKVALVTGGAGEIGSAIVRRFVEEGATVLFTDLPGERRGQLARQRVEQLSRETGAVFEPQDVTDETRWHELVGYTERRFGALHVLVNNAGILGSRERTGPEDLTLDDWRSVQAINVEGPFLGCKVALPALRRAGGGSIVNLASLAALISAPFEAAYGASKAALVQYTKTIAQYGAPDGIRCNALCPGQIESQMMADIYRTVAERMQAGVNEVRGRFTGVIPLGALGRPDDVANAALFLASDEARYVTGAQFVVDGGVFACR